MVGRAEWCKLNSYNTTSLTTPYSHNCVYTCNVCELNLNSEPLCIYYTMYCVYDMVDCACMGYNKCSVCEESMLQWRSCREPLRSGLERRVRAQNVSEAICKASLREIGQIRLETRVHQPFAKPIVVLIVGVKRPG